MDNGYYRRPVMRRPAIARAAKLDTVPIIARVAEFVV
jgi:hypothetical protein